MSEILFAPREDGAAVHLSEGGESRWRKKILRAGEINYKGRKIRFDRDYFGNIVKAFNEGAMDQVAFQLANDENKHNWDPKRYGGEAEKVEIDSDGDLSAVFAFRPDTEELIKANPKLGVSVSLAENPDRADGKKYPVVLGHVLGTLDPKVKGLGNWTPVQLSGYDADATFVDLSAVTLEPAQAEIDPAEAANLTLDQIDAMTDEEASRWLAALGIDPDSLTADDEETEPTAPITEETPVSTSTEVIDPNLSNTDETRTVELAESARMRTELDSVRAQLATSKYEGLRDMYVGKGVPPAFVELARPLLEVFEDSVIELSDDKSVNASDVARQMLDQMAGFVKLNQEKGIHLSNSTEETTEKIDPDAELNDRFAKDPFFGSL